MRVTLTWVLWVLWVPFSVAADVPEKYRTSVEKGLDYLAKQQEKDGSWTSRKGDNATVVTAHTALAFIAEGSTPRNGKYADNVKRAADYLLGRSLKGTVYDGLIYSERRRGEGTLSSGTDFALAHGYAMAFLATVLEDLEPSSRKRALDVLNRAVHFSAAAQLKPGSWGYTNDSNNTTFHEVLSTLSQIQGLHAARAAGIPVPRAVLEKAYDFMEKSTAADGGIVESRNGGRTGGALSPHAFAALAVQASGEARGELRKKWYENTRRYFSSLERYGHAIHAFDYYHYAQAVYQLGEDGWIKLFPQSPGNERLKWSMFREAVFDNLVKAQTADGSWPSTLVGPVYSTALNVTILQLDRGKFPTWGR